MRQTESKHFISYIISYRGKTTNKFDEEADVDCAEKLQDAKREIKVLNYQLSQLVSGINDKSNTLHPRYPVDIEIMEETLMSYKIITKGQYCPMKVYITYNDKK